MSSTTSTADSIVCRHCNTELPAAADFCLSCGTKVEREVVTIASREIDRAWLMAAFSDEGYECAPDSDNPNAFTAQYKGHMNLLVELKPKVDVISICSLWTVNRTRRDDDRLHKALNEFNSSSLFWSAFLIDEKMIGVSTLFTMGERTSAGSISTFLERADEGFAPVVMNTGLRDFMN